MKHKLEFVAPAKTKMNNNFRKYNVNNLTVLMVDKEYCY